ncbi:MAG TPA: radical SAM protein [Candidatus Cloacimonetes bacterium]|nr:radical SAM protein [Candidatus Cloacimonadota bacterium]
MKYRHLFGPVPSRRLGLSLGIDPIPYKTCTFDCIYCECGATTDLTKERSEYISTDEIIHELDTFLESKPDLDYVTFSGSGEPTLNKGIGKIITHIKDGYPEYKIAVLTNSSLFSNKAVRKELLRADLVMPSLDAASEDLFQKINRPAPGITIENIINGLIEFRKEYSGTIWLEIFIVPGINDTKEEINKLHNVLKKINADEIQLNSLDRPGTADWVDPVSREYLDSIRSRLGNLPVTVIGGYEKREKVRQFNAEIEAQILATISRRPCTAEDLTEILDLHISEVNKYLDTLIGHKKITTVRKPRGLFYTANK